MIKVFRLPLYVSSWMDGDTCHGTMDKGHGLMWTPKGGFRLVQQDGGRYDAPEKRIPEQRVAALAAMARASELILISAWHMATSHSKDTDDFGRGLCSIELDDGRDLAGVLIAEGHVK